ncbi:STE20-like serine/threonine-protein kinase isoform X1 [Cimex lectularius]|uniref:Protein kinase domain-containing protein n=1 Tax=Cimex lectularius TaxID=79782 RepID=A0A8I6SGG5_CIMLE|nr:STE20-like serine/threonine-protein kinase isoform X1 [Cimex lectularius]
MVVPEASINNIMSGLESTGGVTLHNHQRKLKQRFETIAKLGQGTYGKVQLGVNKETGQEVAIKTIKKCKIETDADLIRIRREIQIMSSLRHPYIIHIYEVFENRDKIVLVMEYAAGGELYDYLSKKKVLDEAEARRIFRQIAMAVYYCHKHQICHRDLKLENILLDNDGNAKIADFGLSNVFDSSRLLNTFCGSPLYASPEIVKGIPYHGPEVDCWSLGVLLYTLVYGAMPFDGSNFKRLVWQISAGEYYEPKIRASASELIGGLLTVSGTERLDITGVCKHAWMAEEGKVSCYRLAEELAEETPNRLDLLLALAPQDTQPPSVPEEVTALPERPVRSQSLSSLSSVQPSFIPAPVTVKEETDKAKGEEKPKEKERKRERSSSRSRKKESDAEKPKKKSAKSKKKSDTDLPPQEEVEALLKNMTQISDAVVDAKAPAEDVSYELPKEEVKVEPVEKQEPKEKEVKKVKKPKEKEDKSDKAPKAKEEPKLEPEAPKPVSDTTQNTVQKKPDSEPAKAERQDVRRKSKVLEAAELFNKQDKQAQKKPFVPVVKVEVKPVVKKPSVQDAEVKTVTRQPSVQEVETKELNLASTINVNKLVMNELSKDDKNLEEKLKKENAVKVISHAISESELNEKKASTLPRRKLSRPTPPKMEPEHMIANTSSSHVVYPTPPIPPPRPSLVKQDSAPREHIIPIQIESRDEPERPSLVRASTGTIGRQDSNSRASTATIGRQDSDSRASMSSIGRQDSDSSTTTCEPIRKSPREVIIPIAVEGGGYVTPSVSTLSKMSSVTENDEDMPIRGFSLHNTRKHHLQTADSLSSDEDDDNFEMLTTENLFSTLLSRMRHLTHRLDEGRPTFPKLFNTSLFDSPSRRLVETKSFTQNDPTPWRRTLSSGSSSTLPRGFTTKSLRRLLSREEDKAEVKPEKTELPPMGRRRATRTVSDTVQNGLAEQRTKEDESRGLIEQLERGRLSSLERVKKYLEDLHHEEDARARSLRRLRSQASEFDRYMSFKEDLERERRVPRRTGSTSYDRVKELKEFRRSVSQCDDAPKPPEERNGSVLDRYLNLKKKQKLLNRDGDSRVDRAIESLRRNSIGVENEFSESKLLKRAVSLEEINKAPKNRSRRASSLKPDETDNAFKKKDSIKMKKGGVFDTIKKEGKKKKKQEDKTDLDDRSSRISSLKRLDLETPASTTADSTPTGDYDESMSFVSQTDNSDTWSGSDLTERYFDITSASPEECVSERIRRKSFYHRFNMPKRNAYHRSASNMERKRYF